GQPGLWPLEVGGALALTSAFPKRRRLLIAVAALAFIALHPIDHGEMLFALAGMAAPDAPWAFALVVVAGVLLFAWGALAVVRRFPHSAVGRHPVLALLLG